MAVENMIREPGEYCKKADQAINDGEFCGVELNHKRVVLIHRSQFIQAMADNLRGRMLTVSSRRGEKQGDANSTAYKDLLKQVKFANGDWPSDYDEEPNFGETEIMALCDRLRISRDSAVIEFRNLKARSGRWDDTFLTLRAVKDALSCIPISTAECERSFSLMNMIATPKRNRLTTTHLSELMFASIMGPPLSKFNPSPFAKAWLTRGGHFCCG